jgi:hypothetical protein
MNGPLGPVGDRELPLGELRTSYTPLPLGHAPPGAADRLPVRLDDRPARRTPAAARGHDPGSRAPARWPRDTITSLGSRTPR